jgi:large subunit ribosomal protein L29
MKASELRELTVEELAIRGRELREELFNLRFQNATNQLDNTARIPQAKKDLARVETVLQKKRQEPEPGREEA